MAPAYRWGVAFDVASDAYDRFMGRYSIPLATVFADFAGVTQGQRVLDVGCGPGALTTELVARAGAQFVAAVDPSAPFVAAATARLPGVDVRREGAETLSFADGTFDVSLAQLVVQFMGDPRAGLREMRRVTRAGGTVAACVWDHGGGGSPLSRFWEGARSLGAVEDEADRPGARAGDLMRFLRELELEDVEERAIAVEVTHRTFDQWWEPFALGVGPAGVYTARLDPADRERLREVCRRLFPAPPFTIAARAWAAKGRVPDPLPA